jgi:DNA-binding XRE family transcriptional regulator
MIFLTSSYYNAFRSNLQSLTVKNTGLTLFTETEIIFGMKTKQNINAELAKKLKHLAIESGDNQRGGHFGTLAKELGVTRRTIHNIVYGKCSVGLAKKISALSSGAISEREVRWKYPL